MPTKEDYISQIKEEIDKHSVLLYAKGTKEQPRCGFSAMTIEILNSYNVDFEVINVLSDVEKKETLKEFSQWPTIPQLYVNKELVGGSDITRELHESGQLKDLLEKTT
ncbi:MAG: Grx4 family monothiol glutaredoxin [Candidatus Caenarcaniphilales bacterium]|nr:Grx4 family monothiol glutaredoxin [Candidatus Caenarcaniphilales bacterium]